MNIPRSEHPTPQFERENWECLNGIWEFEIDRSISGKERQLFKAEKFPLKILVPFCPESRLSGIGEKDFLNSVWYKRDLEIKKSDSLILLHIGASDYFTTVYINGKEVGNHRGGYTPMTFDITEFALDGRNYLVINAEDDTRSKEQPSGKQAMMLNSYGCFYTRTTGIWQTVWLEYVPKTHIESFKLYPDLHNSSLLIHSDLKGAGELTAIASYEGREVGRASAKSLGGALDITLELSETHPWEAGHSRLYDLRLEYGEDRVKSYFGLRSLLLEGYKFKINGEAFFQRFVLDQGFYHDGIYTAPSDEAMINDIKIAQDAGFNGARLHEKVFEPRFLYHCDRMGYPVWGEYPSWGVGNLRYPALPNILREWEEVLPRDFNHPSIIGWCPLNETDIGEKKEHDDIVELIYKTTKLYDTTRPCIDTSGNFHVITDIFDYHDYIQDTVEFTRCSDKLKNDGILIDQLARRPECKDLQRYKGEASFCSEYGGMQWDIRNNKEAWGYGNAPVSEAEFVERYKALTEALLKNTKLIGFCYTQLYDVEQECNGLYTYERIPKFDMKIFKSINSQKAAAEDVRLE